MTTFQCHPQAHELNYPPNPTSNIVNPLAAPYNHMPSL